MTKWVSLQGPIDYNESLKLMENKVGELISKKSEETIFLLEHNDVYTAGTGYNPLEILGKNGIPVIETGRGGKVTYHGPGQRIIYPILNLKEQSPYPNRICDIKLYIKNLEQWVINTLAALGLKCYTIEGMVGVWTNHNDTHMKISAIGIRIKKWITYHGIAVNISTNLSNYSGIIPCGINNFPVTSLKELGIEVSMSEFDSILKNEFKRIF